MLRTYFEEGSGGWGGGGGGERPPPMSLSAPLTHNRATNGGGTGFGKGEAGKKNKKSAPKVRACVRLHSSEAFMEQIKTLKTLRKPSCDALYGLGRPLRRT